MEADDQSKYQADRLLEVAGPNILKTVRLLELDPTSQPVADVLLHLCFRVFYAGFQTGFAEAGTQADRWAREHGLDFTLNVRFPLYQDEGPLLED